MFCSPGADEDAAGEAKPPKEGVPLFPFVRPPRPLKPPPFPNPENGVGVGVGAELLLAAAVKEKPLKPLNAPLPSF